jgi:pimeloyl-ACP methyl ester carboxylesterase
VNEKALLMGKAAPVVAVVTEPDALDRSRPAFLILNSGLVNHIGPERVYVRAARRMAELGCLAVRMDHRGIGDSDRRRDDLPFFQGAVEEIIEVMDEVTATWGVDRFVLMGICSGAEFSFAMGLRDERVVGTVLINGGGQAGGVDFNRHVHSKKLFERYFKYSIFSGEAWGRALTGRIDYGKLFAVIQHKFKRAVGAGKEVESTSQRMAAGFHALVERGTNVLLIFSGGDTALLGIDLVLGDQRGALEATGRLTSRTIENTDHTLSLWDSQMELCDTLERWVEAAWPAGVPAEAEVEARRA